MEQESRLARVAERLDKLYEYDREPVTPDKLQGWKHFAAFFGGEHVAATEFVIGLFFVKHGASAKDLFLGLLIGNALAVLSWTLICAPIAVRVRLTLYWYLRRIAGPGLTSIYNILNAFLYCILAGAMISVSASAVGLVFKMMGLPFTHPTVTDKYPNSAGWVGIVLLVGAVAATMAILGFKRLSQFAGVCVPWMFAVFIAGGLALLPALAQRYDLGGIHGLSDFWRVAEKIWNGQPDKGMEPFGIWHFIFFAWFCNLAMHVDLSDMAVFRYAKKWTYGFFSAFGMYPGHFLAWIAAGIMAAYIGREENPGKMAYEAVGIAGAICVLIAGWTTANPTIYRAGLALQTLTPNWPRWRITLLAWVIASVLACFPLFIMNLLNFVAIYGLLLMPVGAIVFAEHWLIPKLGRVQYWAEKEKVLFNMPAAITWVVTLLISFPAETLGLPTRSPMDLVGIGLFFRWPPGYAIALLLYLGLSWLRAPRATAAASDG